jgi:Carboxypeptidase regulatory-like domain
MKHILIATLSGLLVCVLLCGTGWAQATAQISGTVRDQSGAVMPGVEITATQTETGIARTTVTNETGSYVLPNLGLGPYRLEAGLPGFRTYVQTGIVLQVNSNPAINPVLEVGQVSEQVEVQANAALVETRTVGVGEVVENERILELPLNGRNVQDLIVLAGGAVSSGDSTTRFFAGTPYVSIGGAPQGFGVDYSLDGAQHFNFATGIGMPMPFPDATQEFKVETGGLSAQRGRSSSVGGVTKSGTNELHGDLFEFVRNDLFNARQYFATKNSTLKRNQFGGTVGGPIVNNKLFFFGGYQGTTVRQDPADQRSFVPTAAMLAGDFTAFTSPGCNAGRQIALRAPFTNNRIDPAQYSKAALNIAAKLPKADNECGEITYGRRSAQNDSVYVGKIDYQWTANHSIFGRTLLLPVRATGPYEFDKNLLLTNTEGLDSLAQSWAIGSTYLINANMVQAFRLSVNRTANLRLGTQFFSNCDVGVKMYCGWDPTWMGPFSVTGGFAIGSSISPRTNKYKPTAYQLNDDLSWVRGSHQMSFGGAVTHARFISENHFASSGTIQVNGQVTGLGLADFLLGRISNFFQGAPNVHYAKQTFFAVYGADTWKATPRVTLSYGLRWEPYLPQTIPNGQIYTFDYDRFKQGIKSTVFRNAPAGLIYPGEPGFPGLKGIHNQWANFAPRAGLAWDVEGNGRTSIRASYAYAYAFVSGDWRDTYNGHPPFGHRLTLQSPAGGLDDPWLGFPGGNPFPYKLDANVVFPPAGIFVSVPYDLTTPSTGSWNLAVQRQVGSWILSGSYIGTKTTHIWTAKPINPATYFPQASCVLNGVNYTPCSSAANIDARRRFTLERPQDGLYLGQMSAMDAGGTQTYHGMVLSVQRRVSSGVTVNANYTYSHCIGPYATLTAMGPHVDDVYTNPDNREFDYGNCDTDRRHVLNVTSVAETPRFDNPTLRRLGSGWRVSVLYKRSAGSPLNILAGSDRALSGAHRPPNGTQRANQILGDPYADRSGRPGKFLNPNAFALPALGTLGNVGRNSVQGPAGWAFDVALSRGFAIREKQTLEFRAEAFNLTNSFRPVNPSTNFNSPNVFGIIREAQDPRILQFALKYVF